MKWFKLLGILTLGAVFIAVASFGTWSASPASANAGPHGNFTLTTSNCAGCHRAHTAVGAYLTKAENIYDLCTTCHDGVRADTNVVTGVLAGSGGNLPLNGGGFEHFRGEAVASSHGVEGAPVAGSPSNTAWGSQNGVADDNGDGSATGPTDGGIGVTGLTLECTSCHNPHGSTNYRILNDAGSPAPGRQFGFPDFDSATTGYQQNPDLDLLQWVDYQVVSTRDETSSHIYAYDVNNVADCPPNDPSPPLDVVPGTMCKARYTSSVQNITGLPAGTSSILDKTKGMNAFCATCHKSYLTSSSAYNWNSLNVPHNPTTSAPATQYMGQQDVGDGAGPLPRYRHSVGRTKSGGSRAPLLPMKFAARGNDPNPTGSLTYDAMGCLTCHFAHGTNAEATGYAEAVGPSNDSALLAYDNRGVCVSCHGGNFDVAPPTRGVGDAGLDPDGQPPPPAP